LADEELIGLISDLQRDVTSLKASRADRSLPDPPDAPEPSEAAAEDESPDLSEQLEEFTELMIKELGDSPLVAGIAVFVAGLLLGRFLR
jgi:hypothetical protein